ncbi:hypothetical protein V8V91_12255 [Algoriphagus halophilus]|uniref:hypothetical protein n=1 Tax=Algoriphagus halophilus TaxID=226505 RepID=UPI00358F60E7
MKKIILPFLFLVTFGMTRAQSDLKVNQERLSNSIQQLASYGKNQAGGSDRVAYSKHDIAARAYVKGLMLQAGLEVSVDYAGNLIGKRREKGLT